MACDLTESKHYCINCKHYEYIDFQELGRTSEFCCVSSKYLSSHMKMSYDEIENLIIKYLKNELPYIICIMYKNKKCLNRYYRNWMIDDEEQYRYIKNNRITEFNLLTDIDFYFSFIINYGVNNCPFYKEKFLYSFTKLFKR